VEDDKMHPRTESTLERLRQEEWFRNVGVRDTAAADVLSSWQEAVESCGSLEWENLCQEAVNQYCARLIERSPRDYEKWNEVVLSVKPTTQALVREKTREIVADNSLPKVFIDTVDWDILHVCMEAEFADIYQPGFYASQAYWYTKGHFPCGWRGPLPQGGRLVIY
jgi:hypothetical protein